MALESISFLTYFLARLPAGTIGADNTLLIHQDEGIRQVEFAAFVEAILVEGGAGTPVTLVEETTLSTTHGVVFVSSGAPLHLPVYATTLAGKRYTIQNIEPLGGDDSVIDCVDGKTINGVASILVTPGETITITKDGANWRTIN